MRSLNNIRKSVMKAEIHTNNQANQKVLNDLLEELANVQKHTPAGSQPERWRTIMKSPVAKLAIAAAIIIVCVTCLWFWKSTGSGIALADVLTKIEQVAAYMYQTRSTITRQQTTRESTSTVLVSHDNGIRITTQTADPNGDQHPHSETYVLPRQNCVLFITHASKTYVRLKFDDTKLPFYREEYNDPHMIVREILSCRHASLGQSVIDGITVEGFQTTDVAYKGGFMGLADFKGDPEKIDVKIWVDVNTFLPVRSEEEIVTMQGTHVHEVSYDFRWNVVSQADDFKPVIPEDYMSPAQEIAIPASNEETAINGLRLFAHLAGVYPVNLTVDTLGKEAKRLMSLEKDFWKDRSVSENEKARKTNELMSLMGPALFYGTLVDEKRDPGYYGQSVTPKDANLVLLRWRVSDNEYRVIFGDLRSETVTAGALAELEKRRSE
jgi:hypothetical protein